MKQPEFSLPGTPANVLLQTQQLLSCLDIEETTINALLNVNASSTRDSPSTPFSHHNLINGLVLFKSIRQRHKIDPSVLQLQGSSTKFWSPNCFKVVKNNIYRVRVCFAQHFFDSNIGYPAKLSLIELLDKNLQPIGTSSSTTSEKHDAPIERLTSVRNYNDQEVTCKAEHVLIDYCIKMNVVSTKNNGPFTLRFTFSSERYQQTWQIPSAPFDVAARLKTQDKNRRGTRSNSSSSTTKRSREASPSSVVSPMRSAPSFEDVTTLGDSQTQQVLQSTTPSPEYLSSSSSLSPLAVLDKIDLHNYLSQLITNNDSSLLQHAQPKRQRTVSPPPPLKEPVMQPIDTVTSSNDSDSDVEQFLEQLGFL